MMNKYILIALVLVLTICAGLIAMVNADEVNVKELVLHMDKLYRGDTSYAKVEMEVINPHWKRSYEMEMWSEGMDKSFITILSPKKDRGISTLRIDREMWNYFPKINKVVKVPPSLMMDSWMGSDFTNDDLVKESTLLEDYTYSLVKQEKSDSDEYLIKFEPKAQTASVWGKILLTLSKKTLLPIKEEYFDEKGNKMRIMTFSEVKKLGGRDLPTVMEVTPLKKKKNKTSIRYIEARFNEKLAKDTFTLRNLKRKR